MRPETPQGSVSVTNSTPSSNLFRACRYCFIKSAVVDFPMPGTPTMVVSLLCKTALITCCASIYRPTMWSFCGGKRGHFSYSCGSNSKGLHLQFSTFFSSLNLLASSYTRFSSSNPSASTAILNAAQTLSR